MQMKDIFPSIVKHQPTIYKVLVMLIGAALIPIMFPQNNLSQHYDYSIGGVWRNQDLVAPHDFVVKKTQNQLDQELAAAKSKMLLYYSYDNTAHNKAVDRLDEMAHRHANIDKRELRKQLDHLYVNGYMEIPSDMPDFDNHTIILLDGNFGSEHRPSEYNSAIDVADTLLRDSIMVPSIVFDANRTQMELESRISQTAASSEMVHQGQLIVAKGDHVSNEQAQMISSLEEENDRLFLQDYNPMGHFLGQFMLCIIGFLALYMFLKNVRHPLLEDTRKVSFVMTLILLMSLVIAFITRSNPNLTLMVPICIIPIMMLVFFDMRVALYVHVTTIVILANMVPNPFEFIFYQLIAGMMSIVTVRNFESRSKFFLVSLVVFCTYSLIYTFGVLSQESTLASITLNRYLIFFGNALLLLLAYPLIYIFEHVFKLTTNLTLMELSSTNNPALRELSRNAPGTFQHSMQVANLSEDLINELGGNSLLAKVGALYHDIGKIVAPTYFTENQTSQYNPHDELEYIESAAIILKHVSDGIDLAKEYHLPVAIQDFIRTHHGTTKTGYFYAKHMEAHPDENTSILAFQYKGPTPYSRETAVVMIVDSVEAACRSLRHPEKEAIDKLVDNIIDNKIKENQFSNCELTFSDIAFIRNFLKNKMMSIYHSRVSYPVAK